MPYPQPYPLIFEPILKPKVWGGYRLAGYGKELPSDGAAIGESWEIADLESTSTDGGGGDAAVSVINSGPLANATIGDAIELWGEALLGPLGLTRAVAVATQNRQTRPAFPLLIKLLDASEHLSVQVHPSPEFATERPEARIKTESWFVLEAEESEIGTQPTVFTGVHRGVSETEFRDFVAEGRIGEALVTHHPRPGDCFTLPSGTCHALGAGVLVAEIQTPSDTTFRVYDWTREFNRTPRDLHLDFACDCISFGTSLAEGPTPVRADSPDGTVAETDFYTVREVSAGWSAHAHRESFVVLMVHRGEGVLHWHVGDGERHALQVREGLTVLVPACLACNLEGASTQALAISL